MTTPDVLRLMGLWFQDYNILSHTSCVTPHVATCNQTM